MLFSPTAMGIRSFMRLPSAIHFSISPATCQGHAAKAVAAFAGIQRRQPQAPEIICASQFARLQKILNIAILDESGINVNMTRFYARSKGGSRAVDAVPLWKPQNATVLSSIQLNGETAYTTYSGGTTSERFVDYLRNVLIPTLSPDSIVVMDNMRSHHTQAAKDLLEQAGVQYLYLPPYSPDLNHIEKMWSKLKAFLRKAKVRLLEKLPDAVRAVFKTIPSHDCSGWFRFCGYSR